MSCLNVRFQPPECLVMHFATFRGHFKYFGTSTLKGAMSSVSNADFLVHLDRF